MLSKMHTITAQDYHHKYQFAPFCGGSTTWWTSHLEAITQTEAADAVRMRLKSGFYFLVGNYILYFQLRNESCFMVELL